MHYLDHAATTPLRPEALAAMAPAAEAWGNPSSLHAEGRRAKVLLEGARARVAAALGAEPGEVVFTSGGTEADTLALRGALAAQPGRPGLVTSAVEHHAVLEPAQALADGGAPVAFLPPGPDGAPSADRVAAVVGDDTGLVSVMLVNNETGARADVAGIARTAHAAGALCHTDAVQAPGVLALDVDALGVDLLTVSAHKLGGPKGAGALYVRSGTPLAAVVAGGAQERRRRGGTENVAGALGLAEALALAVAEREAEAPRLEALRDRLLARLRAALDASGQAGRLVVNTPGLGTPGASAPHILSVSVRPGGAPVDGEMLLLGLDLAGVAVSSGSACTSGALEPSHVLLAAGVPRETAAATVRFSLGRTTTAADVDAGADALAAHIARLGGAGG